MLISLCASLFNLENTCLQTERTKTITTPKIIFKRYMIKRCKYKVNDNRKQPNEKRKLKKIIIIRGK